LCFTFFNISICIDVNCVSVSVILSEHLQAVSPLVTTFIAFPSRACAFLQTTSSICTLRALWCTEASRGSRPFSHQFSSELTLYRKKSPRPKIGYTCQRCILARLSTSSSQQSAMPWPTTTTCVSPFSPTPYAEPEKLLNHHQHPF
jgi:hypothetical protein